MTDRVTVTGAIDAFEDDRIPSSAEIVEKIEALPWVELMRPSRNILRIAWCELPGGVEFGPDVEGGPLTASTPVRYSLACGWLWVQFRREPGAATPDVYVYEDVPQTIYNVIREAKSAGRAHARLVRGHYRYAGALIGSGQTFIEASGIA